MPRPELRQFTATYSTRSDDSGAYVTGRPVVIGQETDLGFCREVIEPGALDNTNFDDVGLFVNHDDSKIPLARSRRNNGNSTMQLTVDQDGLVIDAALDTEGNPDAAALYSAVSRGDITGMSFAFTISGEEWEGLETELPTRHITAIERIFEVSAVNQPAYPQTEITARDMPALDNARRSLDNAREQLALDSAANNLPEQKPKNYRVAALIVAKGRR